MMMSAAGLLEIHSVRQAFPKPDGSQLLVLDDINLLVRSYPRRFGSSRPTYPERQDFMMIGL